MESNEDGPDQATVHSMLAGPSKYATEAQSSSYLSIIIASYLSIL